MTLTPKQIASFVLSAGLHTDATGIIFTFADGTIWNCYGMTPERFAATVAVLHATPTAYLFFDADDNPVYVSSGRDTPGIHCDGN